MNVLLSPARTRADSFFGMVRRGRPALLPRPVMVADRGGSRIAGARRNMERSNALGHAGTTRHQKPTAGLGRAPGLGGCHRRRLQSYAARSTLMPGRRRDSPIFDKPRLARCADLALRGPSHRSTVARSRPHHITPMPLSLHDLHRATTDMHDSDRAQPRLLAIEG